MSFRFDGLPMCEKSRRMETFIKEHNETLKTKNFFKPAFEEYPRSLRGLRRNVPVARPVEDL